MELSTQPIPTHRNLWICALTFVYHSHRWKIYAYTRTISRYCAKCAFACILPPDYVVWALKGETLYSRHADSKFLPILATTFRAQMWLPFEQSQRALIVHPQTNGLDVCMQYFIQFKTVVSNWITAADGVMVCVCVGYMYVWMLELVGEQAILKSTAINKWKKGDPFSCTTFSSIRASFICVREWRWAYSTHLYFYLHFIIILYINIVYVSLMYFRSLAFLHKWCI